MNPYTHSISLRISGDFDPEKLKQSLRFPKAHSKAKGEKRGASVIAARQSYWRESYISQQFYCNADGDVVDSINAICKCLTGKGARFLEISKKHKVELFIGLFGDKNFGFELDQKTMKEVKSLGLALAFDIYPHD